MEQKITKKRIFLKRGLLEQPRSEKWNIQIYIFEKGSLLEWFRPKNGGEGLSGGTYPRTALIWEYPPPTHTHTHPRMQFSTIKPSCSNFAGVRFYMNLTAISANMRNIFCKNKIQYTCNITYEDLLEI